MELNITPLYTFSQQKEEIKFLISNKFRKGIHNKRRTWVLPDSFDEKQDCDIIVTLPIRTTSNKGKITEIDMKFYVHSVHKRR
jgi:hypothetical protein